MTQHGTQDVNTRASALPNATRLCSQNWNAFLVILFISATLFTIRLLAPPNLLDQDQERPASYVLDAVQNGNWLCQRDWTGDITSKPPLWTWLSALATLACGQINEFTLYLPGALAGFGVALLLYRLALPFFGFRAALFGSIAVLMTTASAKQFGLARTDGVFAFTVTLTAILAWRSWTVGRGWTWFWLAAAAATLTKGPLGVLFASAGLVAAFWEYRSGAQKPVRGNHLLGLLLFLAITVGWLLLSYDQLGSAVTDKLLQKELISHASDKKHFPGSQIYQQPLYYLGRAAPWSLLAYFGLWRIWCRPSTDTEKRRLERFLFCWFALGLLILSLASHQRADLLWPVMPAGALIAAIELDRFLQRFRSRNAYLAMGTAVLLGLTGFALYYFVAQARTAIVKQTIAVENLAKTMRSSYPGEFPFTYVDAPMTLQIDLNTSRKEVSLERALELLKGPAPASIAVNDLTAAKLKTDSAGAVLHTLFHTPVFAAKRAAVIVSNRPEISTNSPFSLILGNWLVNAQGVCLQNSNEKEIAFRITAKDWRLNLRNEADASRTWRIVVDDAGRKMTYTRTIPAQGSLTLP